MNGIHTGIAWDLSQLERADRIARSERAELIREAKRLSKRDSHRVAAIRAAFGNGVIAFGRWIRGEREQAIEPLTRPSALHLAR